MELKTVNLKEIHPYPNNPRKNDDAVAAVVESIKQCGYVAPIIVDENYVILAGHTRYKALKSMGGGTDSNYCTRGAYRGTEEEIPLAGQ